MKRVLLFVGTNLAVLMVLGVVMSLAEPWLRASGFDYDIASSLLFAFVIGMGGAFISLAMSKRIALWTTKAKVIEQPANATEQWLLQTVERQARQAGIGMPDVAIYDSPDINAFATGMRRNDALVAVSTGLLQAMNADEAEAVLGHEISHVANGDMVTLTLIQGVLNTFVIFFARIIGMFVDRVVFRNDRGFGLGYFLTYMVAQLILGILASIIVMWFSRWREFRADSGGAHLAGREKMIRALERLKTQTPGNNLPESLEAFGIEGRRGSGFKRLFMSHPPLDERIRALREQQIA